MGGAFRPLRAGARVCVPHPSALGQSGVCDYGYNLAGRLTSLTYPDGAVADYVRNSQGQITEVGVTRPGNARQVLLTGASYYPFGPPKQWTFGNGRVLQRTHDLDYRPWSISDTASGGLSLGYTFNAVGNLAELRDASQAGPPQVTFGYDGLNRLSDFLDGPTSTTIEHYAYNATGDRTLFQNSGGSQTYTYNTGTHRLNRAGSINRWYDASGNTVSIGGTAREYTYTAANRMDSAKQSGVVVMNYRYNGKGERVHQFLTTTGTNQTYTVYDEAGHWVGDFDSTGGTIQQAIWLDDLPVGVLAGGGTSQKLDYVEADALGTPRAVIDPTRNVAIWSWDLKGEAFGNSPPNQNPDGDSSTFVLNLRFPGQQYDSAANLNYNYYRDYDSITGRYIKSDPIGLRGGINPYAYVDSNPLLIIDPFGLAGIRVPSSHSWRPNSQHYQDPGAPYAPPGSSLTLPRNKSPEPDETSIPWDYTVFCVDEWCMQRRSPLQCSPTDTEYKQLYVGGVLPPTLGEVLRRGCDCRKTKTLDQLRPNGEDGASALDLAELTAKVLEAREAP